MDDLPALMTTMDADGNGGVELGEFLDWCEYSMDPQTDQASVDAFERKLVKHEQEQQNTAARLRELTDDVRELQSTNKDLAAAVEAAKAEAAAAKAETSAAGDQSDAETMASAVAVERAAAAAASEERDAAVAKVSLVQTELDELISLVAERDAQVASAGARSIQIDMQDSYAEFVYKYPWLCDTYIIRSSWRSHRAGASTGGAAGGAR